jgi:hypothetical protein
MDCVPRDLEEGLQLGLGPGYRAGPRVLVVAAYPERFPADGEEGIHSAGKPAVDRQDHNGRYRLCGVLAVLAV